MRISPINAAQSGGVGPWWTSKMEIFRENSYTLEISQKYLPQSFISLNEVCLFSLAKYEGRISQYIETTKKTVIFA